MKASIEQINKWMAGEVVENSMFKLNDDVKIISGNNIGAVGSVISLETVSSDPTYLIELVSGEDANVKQSEIEKIHS